MKKSFIKKKKRYDILSPDGFGMFRDKTYASKESAEKAFNKWIERFKPQGYYSTNHGFRIALTDLRDHCKLVVV